MSVAASLASFVDRDVISVSGPDAVSFLQGQLSQDVDALDPGASAYSLVLKPEGKVDAWLRLTRTAEDALLVSVDAGWGASVVTRLQRFMLRVRCELAVLPGWRCVSVHRAELAGAPPIEAATWAAVVAAALPWPGGRVVELLGPDVAPPAGVVLAGEAAHEQARIRAGVPAMGAELGPTTIPAEAGRWFIEQSVSFTKGCYTGQELVARVDSRGSNTPRHLRILQAQEGTDLTADTALTKDGAEVGRVTSAAGSIALAYLKRSVIPPCVVLAGTSAGPVEVAVSELPESG